MNAHELIKAGANGKRLKELDYTTFQFQMNNETVVVLHGPRTSETCNAVFDAFLAFAAACRTVGGEPLWIGINWYEQVIEDL